MPEIIEFFKLTAGFFLATSPFALLAAFLGKTWVEKRIEYSIAHEYDVKLADYEDALTRAEAVRQRQHEQRERAALIGELLACWLSDTDSSREQLNKLAFEAYLWLPEDLAKKVMDALSHSSGAPTTRTLLAEVRKLLHGTNNLSGDQAVIFPRRP